MHITLKQDILHAALRHLIKTIPRTPHLPILSGILCQVNHETNLLTLTSTNLLTGIKLTCAVTADLSGQFIIPGRFFAQIIGSLNANSEIILDVGAETLQITAGRDHITLSLLTGDFPDFPALDGPKTTLSTNYLEQIVNKVSFACGTDLARPILTGIYLNFGETTQAVGTDGFKLSVLTINQQTDWEVSSLLVAAEAFNHVLALTADFQVENIDLVVDESAVQVNFVTPHFIYFAKVIDGNYPPFGRIIPDSFVTEVTFSREEMLEALAKAALFIRESGSIVRLNIADHKLKITGKSTTSNNYEGYLELESFSGEDVEIVFNINYLQAFLSVVAGDSIWLGINDKTKPAMLRDPGDKNWQYIAMPFKAR